MNIYSYVSRNNPYFVKSLANKYGHELNKNPNLPFVLEQLVALHGEQALMEIIEAHPDKDLFQDYYKKINESKMNASGSEEKKVESKCDCNYKRDNSVIEYLNATGSDLLQKNKQVVSNTNLMVLAGAIVIAFAILNLKN